MLEVFWLLVVAFLFMHGLVHLLWFLASWTSVRLGFGDGNWILPGEVTIGSKVGKLWGLAALVVLAFFTVAAVGLLLKEDWWSGAANIGLFLSYGVVVPWWRQSPGSVAITAVFTNILLMFLLALPLSVDLTA
jgi:hypothetical protein